MENITSKLFRVKTKERNVAKHDEPLIKEQLISINKYYMDIDDISSKSIKSEISRKISGYKNQDVKGNIR